MLGRGHAATIAALGGGDSPPYQNQKVNTRDGDQVLMNWLEGEEDKPMVIIFHGLEGCAQSRAVRTLAAHFWRQGWTAAAPHFRSCGMMNMLPRAYHAADAEDVRWMVEYFRALFVRPQVFAIGVSLGGNALIQCLIKNAQSAAPPDSKIAAAVDSKTAKALPKKRGKKRQGKQNSLAEEKKPPPLIDAAAIVSAPLNMAAAARAMSGGIGHALYGRHFMRRLRAKVLQKAQRYPSVCDMQKFRSVKTIAEFDDAYTAPAHGFANAMDYWQKASANSNSLAAAKTPLLCVNALNDPMIPADSLPTHAFPGVKFFRPQYGGHGGFFNADDNWLPEMVEKFFLESAPPHSRESENLPTL